MVEIPMNSPTTAKSAVAGKSGSQRRDALVQRILASFARGLMSVALGGRGKNGVSAEDARAVGRLFEDRQYYASLVYEVAGRFDRLVVSRVPRHGALNARLEAQEDAPPPMPPESEASEEPGIFDFNGESVAAAAGPDRAYALYRRAYPHKPKWIVADASHRVICLCLCRSHA